ncbi:hypothetical protein [Paenibacillus herberti]|uniref:Exosporium protein C n=1 Tax=Paenibacillus herberti TaxID=1619309 RepID=A0A229NZX1_9BACL|nr:hypothetical protein [Paenibacillus herberti]OXM15490.1 hypothetical protein CGZ75_01760 [Paenibacillus herberti]
MSQQFLDLRLSQALNAPTASVPIGTEFILVGDIGLQTVIVANTPMAANVKVMLSGTVAFLSEDDTDTNISLVIEKNGGDTFGSGISIYAELIQPGTNGNTTLFPASINCADFPSVAEVNAGQIRYTLFISAPIPTAGEVTLVGPATFNGIAAADN